MTSTSPASGTRAARLARLRAGAVSAIVVMLAVFGGSASAAVSAEGPPPTAPLGFAIAPSADGVLAQGAPLVVTLTASNPNPSTVAAGRVDLALTTAPLSTRTAVGEWLDGTATPTTATVGTASVDALAGGGAQTVTGIADPGEDRAPGVYGLDAVYHSAQGPLRATSVVVVQEPDAESGEIAVVVPITAGPLTQGLLTADELAALTAPDGALTAQLDAVAGTAAVLAVDPAIAAAIRVLGTTAPESAVTWLNRLVTLPNTRFALQFGDADLATQFQAGLTKPLRVPTLTPSVVTAGFAADPEATPAPGDDPVVPELADLLDIGDARASVYWPAGGTAGADVVERLGGLGDDAADSLTLVPSDTVDDGSGPRARAGEAELLVYDADVSAALREAGVADSDVARDGAIARASAYGALAGMETPLLVTIDRADGRTSEALQRTIRSALRLDGRTPVDLAAVSATDATAVAVADIAPDEDRVRALERFLDDADALTEFATILADPSVLTAPERADILQLMGNAWLDRSVAWEDAVDAHRDETSATLDAVGIVPAPDVTLLGSSAPLTFSVRNDLPWPASLILVALPGDPRLIVQNTTPVEAGALQTTRVDVPVQARVGSGDTTLDLQLRSPRMIAIGDEMTVQVTVRAEWETAGVAAMAVLVGGLLILGVVRTVLRLRRRRQPPADEADADV